MSSTESGASTRSTCAVCDLTLRHVLQRSTAYEVLAEELARRSSLEPPSAQETAVARSVVEKLVEMIFVCSSDIDITSKLNSWFRRNAHLVDNEMALYTMNLTWNSLRDYLEERFGTDVASHHRLPLMFLCDYTCMDDNPSMCGIEMRLLLAFCVHERHRMIAVETVMVFLMWKVDAPSTTNIDYTLLLAKNLYLWHSEALIRRKMEVGNVNFINRYLKEYVELGDKFLVATVEGRSRHDFEQAYDYVCSALAVLQEQAMSYAAYAVYDCLLMIDLHVRSRMERFAFESFLMRAVKVAYEQGLTLPFATFVLNSISDALQTSDASSSICRSSEFYKDVLDYLRSVGPDAMLKYAANDEKYTDLVKLTKHIKCIDQLRKSSCSRTNDPDICCSWNFLYDYTKKWNLPICDPVQRVVQAFRPMVNELVDGDHDQHASPSHSSLHATSSVEDDAPTCSTPCEDHQHTAPNETAVAQSVTKEFATAIFRSSWSEESVMKLRLWLARNESVLHEHGFVVRTLDLVWNLLNKFVYEEIEPDVDSLQRLPLLFMCNYTMMKDSPCLCGIDIRSLTAFCRDEPDKMTGIEIIMAHFFSFATESSLTMNEYTLLMAKILFSWRATLLATKTIHVEQFKLIVHMLDMYVERADRHEPFTIERTDEYGRHLEQAYDYVCSALATIQQCGVCPTALYGENLIEKVSEVRPETPFARFHSLVASCVKSACQNEMALPYATFVLNGIFDRLRNTKVGLTNEEREVASVVQFVSSRLGALSLSLENFIPEDRQMIEQFQCVEALTRGEHTCHDRKYVDLMQLVDNVVQVETMQSFSCPPFDLSKVTSARSRLDEYVTEWNLPDEDPLCDFLRRVDTLMTKVMKDQTEYETTSFEARVKKKRPSRRVRKKKARNAAAGTSEMHSTVDEEQPEEASEDEAKQEESSELNAEQQATSGRNDTEDSNECVVCMDGGKTTAFVPCGHLCVCETCAEACDTCPMCRMVPQTKMRIWSS